MSKNLPILITLSSAAMYVLGLTYYQSYLNGLGFSEIQFPLTFDRIVFKGFIASFRAGLVSTGILYILSLGVFIVAVIGSFLFEFLRYKLNVNVKILNAGVVEKAAKELGRFELFTFQIVTFAMVMLLFFTVLLVVFLCSGLLGKEAAKNFREDCFSDSNNMIEVSIRDNMTSFSGCVVACNDHQCGYLTKKGSIVYDRQSGIISEN